MKLNLSLVVALLVSLAAQSAWAATDAYVVFEGVTGSSVAKGHEKAIVATAFSLDSGATPAAGARGTAAPAKPSLNLTLDVDAATSDLFEKAGKATRIPTVVLDVVVTNGATPERHLLTIKLANAEISKLQIHTKPGVAIPTPVIDMTISAETIEVTSATSTQAASAPNGTSHDQVQITAADKAVTSDDKVNPGLASAAASEGASPFDTASASQEPQSLRTPQPPR